MKALVGLSAIKADANERDAPAEDRWYENADLPKSSEASGKHTAVLQGLYLSLTLASERT